MNTLPWQSLLSHYFYWILIDCCQDSNILSVLRRCSSIFGQDTFPLFSILPGGWLTGLNIFHFAENYLEKCAIISFHEYHKPILYPMLLCCPWWENIPLLENIQLLNNRISPSPLLNEFLFTMKTERKLLLEDVIQVKTWEEKHWQVKCRWFGWVKLKKIDTIILTTVASNIQPVT